MFINNLRNLQNFHIYILSLYFLCNLAVQNRLSKIRILHPDTQKRFEIWKTNGRNGVKRRNEEGGEGKRKRRFPVGEERERGRREQRKGSVARRGRGRLLWQSEAIRAAEKERERGFHKPGYASILHRKPTPTFTLAARPDDSMLKDGRLAG